MENQQLRCRVVLFVCMIQEIKRTKTNRTEQNPDNADPFVCPLHDTLYFLLVAALQHLLHTQSLRCSIPFLILLRTDGLPLGLAFSSPSLLLLAVVVRTSLHAKKDADQQNNSKKNSGLPVA